MDEQLELRQIIADNLAYYRKLSNLTQVELAEKINYSDKSVSKWERAEGVPDIYILKRLADIYNVSVNDFLCKNPQKPVDKANQFKLIVSLLSASIVWLVAVIAYVLIKLIAKDCQFAYLAFIYAIPVSAIVLLVFNCLWGKRLGTCILSSIIIWSTLTSVYLSFITFKIEKFWLIFLIGIPIEVLAILWYFLKLDFRKYIKKKQVKPAIKNAVVAEEKKQINN